MSDDMMRGLLRVFCDALPKRALDSIAPLIDDDIDWTIFGPVDLLPVFGHRRGKQAVMSMIAAMVERLHFVGYETERTLADGQNIASMLRVNARDLRTGRTLILRLALFAQFSNTQLVALRGLFDTFDAAEQTLGRHIDLSTVA
jgi:hypothetical protein